MKLMFLESALVVVACAAGAGGADLGLVTGDDDVEVGSGVVSLALDPNYGGTLRLTGGTAVVSALPSADGVRSKVVWTGGADDPPVPFEVVKNDEFGWIGGRGQAPSGRETKRKHPVREPGAYVCGFKAQNGS